MLPDFVYKLWIKTVQVTLTLFKSKRQLRNLRCKVLYASQWHPPQHSFCSPNKLSVLWETMWRTGNLRVYKQQNIFYNSSSLGSVSADLTVQLQYWYLNYHHLLGYFPTLAEKENFVFQRQEASLSTRWGLGEAKENDPSSLSHPAWQSVCFWCLHREVGKVEPHQTQSTQPIYLFPWDCSSSSRALWCAYVFIYALTWIWPFLVDSESGMEEYGGKAPAGFHFLQYPSRGRFSHDVLALSFPFGFVPSHTLT